MAQDASRVVLVTGAAQGLGRAFAHRFAADGARVVVTDRDLPGARRVRDELAAGGSEALAVQLDVADEAQVADGVQETVDAFGRVDVLVNNAAVFSTIAMKPFEELALDEWETALRVNLTGMFLCARAVAPHMRRQRYGRIVNLSSSTVLMGRPRYLHYVASKSGVIGFTRALARELGDSGVTVNAVMPGATRTEVPRESMDDEQIVDILERQSIHEPLTPQDIAAGVAFAASDENRLMTGQILVIDGGLSFI